MRLAVLTNEQEEEEAEIRTEVKEHITNRLKRLVRYTHMYSTELTCQDLSFKELSFKELSFKELSFMPTANRLVTI